MTKHIQKQKWEFQKLIMLIILSVIPVMGYFIVRMRNWTTMTASNVCNVSIDIVGMLILLIMYLNCIKDRDDDTLRTGCFTYMLTGTAMALFFDLICWSVNGIPSLITENILANEGYYASGTVMVMIFWHYLVEVADTENPKITKISLVLNIGCIISLVSLIGNYFGRYYFDVDEAGNYARGTYYMFSQLYILLMLICFFLLIMKMGMEKDKKRALMSFIILPLIATVLQTFLYGITVIYISLIFSLLIIYGNVFSEHRRQLALQQIENLQKEREILLEKQKQKKLADELSLAADIQNQAIPKNFPDSDKFSLFASMDAAKQVGGDFYDFFMMDEDHLALVIADVSGKGIPAALFMMTAKTMIKHAALQGLPPEEIFAVVNNQLCAPNEVVGMFVTAWIGILELSTGIMTASNAGHLYPAVTKRDGNFELIKDKHGLALGGMEDMVYTSYEIHLNPGDALFVYTDGVTEAMDEDEELFGTARMLDSLNHEPSASPDRLIANMTEDIARFVGDEEQTDDITMLAFRMA